MRWLERVAGERGHERDTLLVAGDVSADTSLLRDALAALSETFHRVFFVPGNHELWLTRADERAGVTESARKLEVVLRVAEDAGALVSPADAWDARDDRSGERSGESRGRQGGGAGRPSGESPRGLASPAGAGGRDDPWRGDGGGGSGDSLARAGALPPLVAPILSWHHASWDREADVPGARFGGLCADYAACRWPEHALPAGEHPSGERLATWADALVEARDPRGWTRVWGQVRGEPTGQGITAGGRPLPTGPPPQDLLSMSHFVPFQQLLPEKRFLTHPGLARASGSASLGRRVARLQPSLHVFGHTHFGWDFEAEGVRCVQACLGSGRERDRRLKSLLISPPGGRSEGGGSDRGASEGRAAASSRLPSSGGGASGREARADGWWLPAPVYASEPLGEGWVATPGGGFLPPPYSAAWSDHYRQVARTPDDVEPAPWTARARALKRRGRSRGRASPRRGEGGEGVRKGTKEARGG